jgi:hypothetical protein
LGFGCINLFDDWTVEASIEENGVIMTAGAPFGWRGSDDLLHVLDRTAVPLVVDRREVVGGGVPLFVNVAMASAAGLTG